MSMLGPDWSGRAVLDCFAGSGAFGFEALSRGAQSASFIEKNAATCRRLQETAETLGVASKATVMRGDAERVLRGVVRRRESFDVLFFDPPYAEHALLCSVLAAAVPLLRSGSRMVAELSSDEQTPAIRGIACLDRREYGGTAIAVFAEEADE